MNDTVLKLWIVDDERAMCHGVVRAMQEFAATHEDLGETVRFAATAMESGEAFLDRINKEPPPHILLLDGKLPGIDGLEVMRIMEQKAIPIVTIMITAYATLDNAVRATKLGAFDFLAKPFTPAELRHAVAKASREIILLRRARQLEQEKRQVRFEFLSVLAHELKSPLAAVEGYVDMLRQGPPEPEVLDRMELRIQGMRKLIGDLLDLTAIESGKRRREIRELDVAGVARDVVDAHIPMAKPRNITLEMTAKAPCLMEADRSELEMLLSNLVSNAVKYNRRDGRVTVDVHESNGEIVMCVTDTGIGISQQEQEKLFAEFSRIKNRKTQGIEGSGLGLSIVRKIAGLYGGTVTVSSEAGKGSVFTTALFRGKPGK